MKAIGTIKLNNFWSVMLYNIAVYDSACYSILLVAILVIGQRDRDRIMR